MTTVATEQLAPGYGDVTLERDVECRLPDRIVLRADVYESVEWAAGLRGSSGKVGMYGFSYPGATQLLAAVAQPPSLGAIAPGFTSAQFYEGWTHTGGAFSLASMAGWASFLATEAARRRGDESAHAGLLGALGAAPALYRKLPLRDYLPLLDVDGPYFRDSIEHSSFDDYWRPTAVDDDFSRITVPGLHTGGWYDIFHAGTVANFRGMGPAAQKLLMGPWQHSPWRAITVGPRQDAGANEVDDWHLRFFDEVLKGERSGVFDHPGRVFVLGEDWRDVDGWPPSQSVESAYYLHSGGRANSAYGDGTLARPADRRARDVYVYDPLMPSMSFGGHSCCSETIAPMGPADQEPYEASKGVLVYTTEPIERELVLLGDAAVDLYASSTALDTDFTARLCLVDRDGTSTNLKEGIVRARFRESLAEPSLLEPGRVYRFTIPLGPLGVRLGSGQRIRLDISSSDFPQWDRNLNTGGPLGMEPASAAAVATQAVFHDSARASRLRLPVERSRT